MTISRFACAVLAALALGGAADAQDVAVTPLAPPDLFSTGVTDTGLGPDLWRGASAETARAVIPLLGAKPLSPAARGLARRVLAAGASGPDGAGQDLDLAAARVAALIAAGGSAEAGDILARMPGLDRSPALARAAAEAALLAYDAERACAISRALAVGRDEIYWLRLRAYCQHRAGEAGAAQLTFDLAQSQDRDSVYGRLMGAKLAGAGDPGAAALRNGLDYALSRHLGLDLSAAKAAPAVAAVLSPEAPAALPLIEDPVLADAVATAAAGLPDAAALERLVERAAGTEGRAKARAQNAVLLYAALGPPVSPRVRGEIARFAGAEATAPGARLFALELAADAKLPGETALLALWVSAEAGGAGPAPGDRARIVRALRAAGLEADARAYAAEGLAALK